MARPPVDLEAAVHGAARRPKSTPAPDRSPTKKPRSRDGTKGIVTYVSPELSLALRRLALDEGTTLQALGLEAFRALMQGRGRGT